MAMFDKLAPQNTRCIRDGEKLTVPADFLTHGDVIELKLGDIIPADIRILSSRQLSLKNLEFNLKFKILKNI
jgi:magnesium-transporting ATPase (P-type)